MEQQEEPVYSIFSNPVEVAGFQWKLRAVRRQNGLFFGLYLRAIPPAHYEGPFEFEVVDM